MRYVLKILLNDAGGSVVRGCENATSVRRRVVTVTTGRNDLDPVSRYRLRRKRGD